ncbi:sigma-70 family RNA polymerase sigma factor [Sporosarcina sp. FSL K6-1508]|uniref:sigma-70 family RNA polymerase sigma factor n=1 Tax=Sporosarcina sp. FSL K6-1508 TaxID=2921553 RepID=UPI0030F983F9
MAKLIDGELRTKESIVSQWSAYVNSQARKVRARAYTLGFEHCDVVSEGNIGLLKAYDRYEEGHEVLFSALASKYIPGTIYNALRGPEIGLNYSRSIKELGYAIRREELGKENPQIIAEKLGALEKNVKYALEFLTHRFPGRLESPLGSDSENLTLGDSLTGLQDGTNLFVKDFIASLSDWEVSVLELISAGYGQTESARLLDSTQNRVARSLVKMRGKYEAYSNGVEYIEPRRGSKKKVVI